MYADPKTAVPLSKVGSSDFYFAVSNDRPDILVELDAALNRIQDENALICQVFHHSPVFRVGGDEFTVFMLNEDYENRERLTAEFESRQKAICETAKLIWEEVRVALGVAVYDPANDRFVDDTVRRADKIMYDNKRIEKQGV